jgi:hypothetical protein
LNSGVLRYGRAVKGLKAWFGWICDIFQALTGENLSRRIEEKEEKVG